MVDRPPNLIEEPLSVSFFCIRAVRRQVCSPHTASRFSVWYRARLAAGDPDYPAEQAYGDWLDVFRSWYELEGLEGNAQEEEAMLLPGVSQPGAVSGHGTGAELQTSVHPARDRVSGREGLSDHATGRDSDD
jgi:hypothetical protein